MQLSDVLDDLFVRFILNLPPEELASNSRLGFQVEQAYWFYEDFCRPSNEQRLPKLHLAQFVKRLLLQQSEWLAEQSINVDSLFEDFKDYKLRVPTCGAIILNPARTKCLLVRGYNGKSWGFPKGKIAKDEDPAACAVREVLEETGFDISKGLVRDSFLQSDHDASIRLYIIDGVEESQAFQPLTRREIGEISWFLIDELMRNDGNIRRFYNVHQFLWYV